MGKCIYCGKSAGVFSSKHKECVEKFNEGFSQITTAISNFFKDQTPSTNFFEQINMIAQDSFINDDSLKIYLSTGFGVAVNDFLEDDLLTQEEENRLISFVNECQLKKEDLNLTGKWNKVVMASILRDIVNGEIPTGKFTVSEGELPFNFLKDEKLIWAFVNADYYEQITNTHYEGRSQGISIKIAKGLYYRTGQFKGNPVRTTEMKLISVGILALTDQNLYFSSPVKSLRIPYQKILTINEYSDGIGIQEDKATAKPKTFGHIDGWFVYNVIRNLSNGETLKI